MSSEWELNDGIESIKRAWQREYTAKVIIENTLENTCAENAKLRERVAELEKLEDGKRYIRQEWYQLVMTENEKLRELVRDMFDGMCDHDRCDICPHWQEGYNGCEYHERMRELGVEV